MTKSLYSSIITITKWAWSLACSEKGGMRVGVFSFLRGAWFLLAAKESLVLPGQDQHKAVHLDLNAQEPVPQPTCHKIVFSVLRGAWFLLAAKESL